MIENLTWYEIYICIGLIVTCIELVRALYMHFKEHVIERCQYVEPKQVMYLSTGGFYDELREEFKESEEEIVKAMNSIFNFNFSLYKAMRQAFRIDKRKWETK